MPGSGMNKRSGLFGDGRDPKRARATIEAPDDGGGVPLPINDIILTALDHDDEDIWHAALLHLTDPERWDALCQVLGGVELVVGKLPESFRSPKVDFRAQLRAQLGFNEKNADHGFLMCLLAHNKAQVATAWLQFFYSQYAYDGLMKVHVSRMMQAIVGDLPAVLDRLFAMSIPPSEQNSLLARLQNVFCLMKNELDSEVIAQQVERCLASFHHEDHAVPLLEGWIRDLRPDAYVVDVDLEYDPSIQIRGV